MQYACILKVDENLTEMLGFHPFLLWFIGKYIKDKKEREVVLKVKNRKTNCVKIVIQLLSFILIPGLFATGFTAVGDIVSQIYEGSISWESVRYSVYVLIATVPGSVLVGRFFCGFFCSFGAVQDLLWFAARKLRKGNWKLDRNPDMYKKADRVLKLAKYGVLAYFVIFIWSGILSWKGQGPWEVFGQYIVLGHWPGVKSLCSIGGILLLMIFMGSVFVKRFFCRYFCPMGAMYALISRGALLKIEKPGSECGACHLCTAKCSMGIDLTKKERVAGGECIECQQCINWCPKGNAHFGIKYGMLIGVGVTCALIGGSQLLIARSYTENSNIADIAAQGSGYEDGTYTGTGAGYRGAVTVTVNVVEGKITSLTLDSYEDDKSYMEKAKSEIFSAIIGRQNTDADTVSGATYSSKGLIQAVENALKEAGKLETAEDVSQEAGSSETGKDALKEAEDSETVENVSDDNSADKAEFISAGRFRNLTDGVYTGSADAFRGDVEVQVTVENQQVTDISILSYCDTEEYFFKAAPVVIEEMKEEQSLNIDAVSGATYSSNGIIHAVANALDIPEDQYAQRPGRNLAAKKKNHGHIVKHVIESQEEYEEKVREYAE